MVATELVTKFSFMGSLKPLDNLNAGLTSAVGTITKVAGAFSVAGVALNGFLAHTLDSTDALVQLSRETDINIATFQELGYVASVNGSSIEDMTSSLNNLSKKIGHAALYGSAEFSRLGVSVRDVNGEVKDAETVFYEVKDAMQQMGLTVQEQKDVMGQLGINESLIQTMRLTSSELDNLRNRAKDLGVVSQEDGNKIASFNDSLTTLKYGLGAVQKHLAIAFAPQLEATATGFTDLLIANKQTIREGLEKFFTLVNSGLGAIYKFGKMLYKLIDNTIGLKNALMLAGAGMLYMNRAMLANPVAKIITLISGLIIAYDDLTVGLQGGKSVIAEWFKEWFNIDILSLLKDIGSAFDVMKEKMSVAFDVTLSSIKSGFKSMKEYVVDVLQKLEVFFKPISDLFDKVSNFKMPSFVSDFFGNSETSKKEETVSTVKLNNESVKNIENITSETLKREEIKSTENSIEKVKLISEKTLTSENEKNIESIKNKENIKENVVNTNNITNTKNISNVSNMLNKEMIASRVITVDKTIQQTQQPTNTVENNNNITIEVKTDNAQLAGQQVYSELKGALENASVNFGVGGR